MSGKTSKRYLFEVKLNWLADTRGILTAKDADGVLHVAAPPSFGGEGKPWTPEHYLLNAVASCYMTTFLHFAKKERLPVTSFECNAIGQIELVDGRLKFTTIDVYPKIFIDSENLYETAVGVLEKTHKHCLVSNSLNATVYYHTELLVVSGQTV